MRQPSLAQRARSATRRLLAVAILFAVGAIVAYVLWAGPALPTATLLAPLEVVGRNTPIGVAVESGRAGLRRIEVRLEGAAAQKVIAEEEIPRAGLLGSGQTSRTLELHVDAKAAGLAEGQAQLVVRAQSHAPLSLLRGAQTVLTVPLVIDWTPPNVAIQGGQRRVTVGGSELLAFTASADTVRSGVQVGPYFFQSFPAGLADPSLRVAIFAVPWDLDMRATAKLWAEDRAGNRREVSFPLTVKDRKFRAEDMEIGDAFLEQKIPEIIARNDLAPPADPVDAYLLVNRDLRRKSEEQIHQIVRASAEHALFDGPFLQLPGSQVGSRFAEQRTYRYKGRVIDRQTHLGYDLASVKHAPVLAANAGTVLFSDNLGIYGNAIVIDHGLGLATLYAHLSDSSVAPGQAVTRGEAIGHTGETGLAGGDHLHFSILLDGTHVDPVEWWDAKWMRDHGVAEIAAAAGAARAAGVAPAGSAPAAAGTASSTGPGAAQ